MLFLSFIGSAFHSSFISSWNFLSFIFWLNYSCFELASLYFCVFHVHFSFFSKSLSFSSKYPVHVLNNSQLCSLISFLRNCSCFSLASVSNFFLWFSRCSSQSMFSTSKLDIVSPSITLFSSVTILVRCSPNLCFLEIWCSWSSIWCLLGAKGGGRPQLLLIKK